MDMFLVTERPKLLSGQYLNLNGKLAILVQSQNRESAMLLFFLPINGIDWESRRQFFLSNEFLNFDFTDRITSDAVLLLPEPFFNLLISNDYSKPEKHDLIKV